MVGTAPVFDPTLERLAIELDCNPAALRVWMKAEGIRPYIRGGVECVRRSDAAALRRLLVVGDQDRRSCQLSPLMISQQAATTALRRSSGSDVGVQRELVQHGRHTERRGR